MKYIALILAFSFMNIFSQTTTIFLTRHAEKQADLGDPSLMPEGLRRAEALSQLSENYDFTGVYSSGFQRTIQTAAPLAQKLALDINTNIGAMDYQTYLEDVLENHKGGSVLIVGHNNTIPELINFIMDKRIIGTIPHEDYSNLFKIRLKDDEEKSFVHYRYEAEIDGGLELKRL